MEVKHALFNTGFAGAKVVCDASGFDGSIDAIDKAELMLETSVLLKVPDLFVQIASLRPAPLFCLE